MRAERTVLLVSPSAGLRALEPALRRAGCRLTVAKTFQTAKTHLNAAPDLLITELKLGEYNGLHLALRSKPAGIPTIVVADQSFEHEIEQLGAVWVSPEHVLSEELQASITEMLDAAASTSRQYAFYDSDGSAPIPGVLAFPIRPTLH